MLLRAFSLQGLLIHIHTCTCTCMYTIHHMHIPSTCTCGEDHSTVLHVHKYTCTSCTVYIQMYMYMYIYTYILAQLHVHCILYIGQCHLQNIFIGKRSLSNVHKAIFWFHNVGEVHIAPETKCSQCLENRLTDSKCLYIHVYVHGQLIFSRKSDCLGCAVLLCLVCLFV